MKVRENGGERRYVVGSTNYISLKAWIIFATVENNKIIWSIHSPPIFFLSILQDFGWDLESPNSVLKGVSGSVLKTPNLVLEVLEGSQD
jgi:hypothetical protein